jgi:hypothetical protein
MWRITIPIQHVSPALFLVSIGFQKKTDPFVGVNWYNACKNPIQYTGGQRPSPSSHHVARCFFDDDFICYQASDSVSTLSWTSLACQPRIRLRLLSPMRHALSNSLPALAKYDASAFGGTQRLASVGIVGRVSYLPMSPLLRTTFPRRTQTRTYSITPALEL